MVTDLFLGIGERAPLGTGDCHALVHFCKVVGVWEAGVVFYVKDDVGGDEDLGGSWYGKGDRCEGDG